LPSRSLLAGFSRSAVLFQLSLPSITEVLVNTEPQEIPHSLRLLSKGSFAAQCGKCMRLSLPVDAIGPEHAWSELLKLGWTWYTTPAGGHGYSCLECLKASARSPRRSPS
jgi:hypothetical protein